MTAPVKSDPKADAKAAAAHAEAVAAERRLTDAQTAHARALKLKVLARKYPPVRAVLAEFEALRERLAAAEQALAEAQAEAARVREELAAALSTKKPRT